METPENLLIIEQFVRKCNLILSNTSSFLQEIGESVKPPTEGKKRLVKLEEKQPQEIEPTQVTEDMVKNLKQNCELILSEVSTKVQKKLTSTPSKSD